MKPQEKLVELLQTLQAIEGRMRLDQSIVKGPGMTHRSSTNFYSDGHVEFYKANESLAMTESASAVCDYLADLMIPEVEKRIAALRELAKSEILEWAKIASGE